MQSTSRPSAMLGSFSNFSSWQLTVEAHELEFISVTMQDPFTKVNNNIIINDIHASQMGR